jgi:hypothetical protein
MFNCSIKELENRILSSGFLSSDVAVLGNSTTHSLLLPHGPGTEK